MTYGQTMLKNDYVDFIKSNNLDVSEGKNGTYYFYFNDTTTAKDFYEVTSYLMAYCEMKDDGVFYFDGFRFVFAPFRMFNKI